MSELAIAVLDEAKRLQVEVARLRDALKSIAAFDHTPHNIIGYINEALEVKG